MFLQVQEARREVSLVLSIKDCHGKEENEIGTQHA